MRRMRFSLLALAAVILTGLPFAGCAKDKAPADAAIKAAEASLDGVRAEASKYVPDMVQAVDAHLASAKDKFAKGDYQGALADAQAAGAGANELAAATEAKKAEAASTWETLSAGLPPVIESIKSRVDILSKSRKLPANVTAEALASAQAGLAEMEQQWAAANAAAQSGNVAEAANMATSVKARAVEVMGLLAMEVPPALLS
jgi:hypothetical protein